MFESMTIPITGPRFLAVTSPDDPTCDVWLNLNHIITFAWHGEVETGAGTVQLTGNPGVLKIDRESYEAILDAVIDENGGWR